jgi:hypothetical protein
LPSAATNLALLTTETLSPKVMVSIVKITQNKKEK